MGRVQGKVAIITGAGSMLGLGYAAALRLSEEGAAVVLTDVNESGVAEGADAIVAKGGRAISMKHDVTSADQWQQVVDKAEAEFGQVDILVNNAGIVAHTPIAEMTPESFRRVLDVNLTGVFLGTQAAVRAMRKHGKGGAIVNVSSTAGLIGYPNLAGYNSSKGGVRLLTKSVALECATENIRCNSVHPGSTKTDLMADAMAKDELPPGLLDSIPMRRPGEPREVANAILFLACDESAYVTGAELVVDGGATAM